MTLVKKEKYTGVFLLGLEAAESGNSAEVFKDQNAGERRETLYPCELAIEHIIGRGRTSCGAGDR